MPLEPNEKWLEQDLRAAEPYERPLPRFTPTQPHPVDRMIDDRNLGEPRLATNTDPLGSKLPPPTGEVAGLTPLQRRLVWDTFHADPKVEQLRVAGVTVTRTEWEEEVKSSMFDELLRMITQAIQVQDSRTPAYPSRADACLAAFQWFVKKSPEHHNYVLRLLQVKEQGGT